MLRLRSSGAMSVVVGYSWFGRYSSSGISDASSALASLVSSGVSASAANGLEVLDDSAVGVMIFGFPFIAGQRCSYRGG